MKRSTRSGDADLRAAHAAFEQAVVLAVDEPVPALPAFVGLVRAVTDVTRFVLDVALADDRTDPIDLEPRILRA